ncbi:MAG: sulfite exporter TauE/SafE family protein [Pyrobaculum sp.]
MLDVLALMFFISLAAGFIGALSGLGGGVVLIPLYVSILGLPLRYAAGASLIATIATSGGSSLSYIRRGVSNIRIAMSLSSTTTSGALIGSITATKVYNLGLEKWLYITFGVVLILSVFLLVKRGSKKRPVDKWTKWLRLCGRYFDEAEGREVSYCGARWGLAALVMFSAGFLSGLLGIGGGTLNVLALDWGLGLPPKVSTTTSNLILGITAATSAAVYWHAGYIQPFFAGVTALGVLTGSYLGTKALSVLKAAVVRYIFLALTSILGIEMILRGVYAA